MFTIQDEKGINQVYAHSPAQKLRIERRAQAIIREFPEQTQTVIELGSGQGEMANYIHQQRPKLQIYALDQSHEFTDMAIKNYDHSNGAINSKTNLIFKTLCVGRMPLNTITQNCDAIFGNGILHHLYENIDQALGEFHSLLNSQGKIIFWEPNLLNPYVCSIFKLTKLRKLAKLDPTEMAFSKPFIERALANAHFKNIKVEYRDFLLPVTPTPLISPLLVFERLAEKTPAKFLSQSMFICAEKQ